MFSKVSTLICGSPNVSPTHFTHDEQNQGFTSACVRFLMSMEVTPFAQLSMFTYGKLRLIRILPLSDDSTINTYTH